MKPQMQQQQQQAQLEKLAKPLPGEEPARPKAWPFFAVAAAALALFVGAMAIRTPAAPALPGDPREGITAQQHAQLDENRQLLEKQGLKAGQIMVRDWGAIDGDGVSLNGSPAISLDAQWRALSAGAGSVILTAKQGELGCSSVEIRDETGASYQLCLMDGEPIRTYAK